MKLGVVPVASSLQSQEEIKQSSKEIEDRLLESSLAISSIESLATDVETAKSAVRNIASEKIDALVYFVGSGGTERPILESSKNIEVPILLFSNSSNNSFAASCEVLPRLRSEGKFAEVFFEEKITPENIRKKIKKFKKVREVIQEFKESHIGLIGKYSPWLVSSMEDLENIQKKLGPKVTQVELSELEEKIDEISNSKAESVTREITSRAADTVEPSEEETIQAAKIYLGLKSLIKEKGFDAISVGCFELLPIYDNTGCLALSRLNDEGTIAGCEGDLDAALTMLMLYELTGEPGWMANVASVNPKENSLTLAHCTVPLSILDEPPMIRSHFESGKGVSFRGYFDPDQKGTIARLGGIPMDRIVIGTGTVKRSDLERGDMCRTQVEIETDGNVETLLESAPGNHLVFSKRDVSSELKTFAKGLNLDPILV